MKLKIKIIDTVIETKRILLYNAFVLRIRINSYFEDNFPLLRFNLDPCFSCKKVTSNNEYTIHIENNIWNNDIYRNKFITVEMSNMKLNIIEKNNRTKIKQR